MSELETPAQSRRIEQLRPVETSPGVKVYRAGSIARRLVTEGTTSAPELTKVELPRLSESDAAS